MSEQDKNRRLGRSLEDLLRSNLPKQVEAIQKDASRTRSFLPVNLIKPNPFQPRKSFNETKLQELAASIREWGIITPILVRPKDDYYEIVAGERRFRAALLCGLDRVPVVSENFDDDSMIEIALIENIQRADLTALDEAYAYDSIMKKRGISQAELARRLGKSRPYVANILRLLKLPKKVQSLVATGDISMGHARALVGVPFDAAREFAARIKKEKLSVRDVEEATRPYKKKKFSRNDEARELGAYLQTKVLVDKNWLKIAYKNTEDLSRIIDKISGKKETK